MNPIDITENAWATIRQTIENPDFSSMDDQLIYDCLTENMEPVPFSTYLKRFLYRQAKLEGPFEEVPLSEYIDILVYSFRENSAPASFISETVPIRQNATSWLCQKSARRVTALLLGFGLGLTREEVDGFLTKAMRLQRLNPEDPFELCCAYCYEHQFRYPKFAALWDAYQRAEALPADGVPTELSLLTDDQALLERMRRLKNRRGLPYIQEKAREAFEKLYDAARDVIADYYNNTSCMQDVCTREKITPRDLEAVISAAIPVSDKGNLVPASRSSLGELFGSRFFNRQRVSEILSDRVPADRFDLLTLHFFLCASESLEREETPRGRFNRFLSEGDRILKSCGMGPVYPANPYEAFLLMCMICDAPLSSYADVWEKAYMK